MNTFQLSKKDLRILLASATFLPIIFFASGLYFANSFQSQNSVTTQPVAQTLSLTTDSTTIDKLNNEAETPVPSQLESTAVPSFTVQAGVFSNPQNAFKYQHHLLSLGIDNTIQIDQNNGLNQYRIMLESFELQEQASQFISDMKQEHSLELYVSKIQDDPQFKEIATI